MVKLVFDSGEPPDNGEARRARQEAHFAQQDAHWALRRLAGTLLRVIRGRGSPGEVYIAATKFVDAVEMLEDRCGYTMSSDAISSALAVGKPVTHADGDRIYERRQTAVEDAINGALQVAASRLLMDHLRAAGGMRELIDAMSNWNHRAEPELGDDPVADVDLTPEPRKSQPMKPSRKRPTTSVTKDA